MRVVKLPPQMQDAVSIQDQAAHFLSGLKTGIVAVAVSGGSDSLATLHAICAAKSTNHQIVCFTVDHQLRAEAKAEANYVAKICHDLGVSHTTLIWDGKKPESGVQQAARHARYELLTDACKAVGAIGLVTGHTQDDQIETLAMRQARDPLSAGKGMSGMSPMTLFNRNLWVLRPFLGLTKADLQAYLRAHDLTWIEDPSNQNLEFERVRVRNAKPSPGFVQNSDKYQSERIRLANAAVDYLTQYVQVRDGLWADVQLDSASLDVQLRALEALIDTIGGRDRRLSSHQLEMLRTFIDQETGGKMTLGRTLLLKKSNRLTIEREARDLEELIVMPQTSAVWDQRFIVHNHDQKKPIRVMADEGRKGLPPLVCKHNFGVGGVTTDIAPSYQVERFINRFDGVILSFDFHLANAVAKQFGRSDYPEFPIQL